MTAHRHDFPAGAGHNLPPCRLCAGEEDDDTLVASLAEALWNDRPGRLHECSWEDAGPYWHDAFKQFARATLRCVRRV